MFLQIGCKNTKNFRQHHNPSPTILVSTDPVALGIALAIDEGFPMATHRLHPCLRYCSGV